MGHDWILDVLTDLKTFSRANGLPALASQLEDASFVAQLEIASKLEKDQLRAGTAEPLERRFGLS
jgi:hypothetical protein